MIVAQTTTTWPEAAVAMAGIALTAVFVFVVVSQVFQTWRARASAAREDAYRKLAQQAAEAERRSAEGLERTAAELGELRSRTAELERLLKEIE